jgi:hypothetical protein
MGHERVGVLPKTKRWRAIVAEMARVDVLPSDVPEIAKHTLEALGARYTNLAHDPSIATAFRFLVDMARSAAGQENAGHISQKSPLTVVAELGKHVYESQGSLETAEVTKRAAADAIVSWARQNATTQEELFADTAPGNRWSGLETGAGFCELSRLFFSRLTERYLRYFLEREASAVMPNLGARGQFSRELQLHIAEVSKHAFETAKITESFAAGWYNKYATRDRPTDAQIRAFLSHAFSKLREDLRRESRQ